MFTRSLYLLVLSGLVVGASPLTAQRSAEARALRAVLYDTERPDYITDIVSIHLPRIDMPVVNRPGFL